MTVFLVILAIWFGYGFVAMLAYCLYAVMIPNVPFERLALAAVTWPISWLRILAAYLVQREAEGRPIAPLPASWRIAIFLAALGGIALITVDLHNRAAGTRSRASASPIRAAKWYPTAAEESAIVGPKVERAAYQGGIADAAVRGARDEKDCAHEGMSLRAYRAGCLAFVARVKAPPRPT